MTATFGKRSLQRRWYQRGKNFFLFFWKNTCFYNTKYYLSGSNMFRVSNTVNKIEKTKDVVLKHLEVFPHLRDCDEKLVATIWRSEIEGLNYNVGELSAYGFLKLYADGKLTQADRITRARRRIQEAREELRGTRYLERKENEDIVRKAINK